MKKNVDPIEHYGNRINESLVGLLGAGIVGILFGSNLVRALKIIQKISDNNPEILAATADMKSQSERLKDIAMRVIKDKKKK